MPRKKQIVYLIGPIEVYPNVEVCTAIRDDIAKKLLTGSDTEPTFGEVNQLAEPEFKARKGWLVDHVVDTTVYQTGNVITEREYDELMERDPAEVHCKRPSKSDTTEHHINHYIRWTEFTQ